MICKKYISVLVFILISNILTAQEPEYVDAYTAPKIFSELTRQLNTFCEVARKEYIDGGAKNIKILYGPNRKYILQLFTETIPFKDKYKNNLDSIAPQIKNDLVKLNGSRFDEKSTITISDYLDKLSIIAAKKNIVYNISYCGPLVYSKNKDTVVVKAKWAVRSHENSYIGNAEITFVYNIKGEAKIDLVSMTGFEDTENLTEDVDSIYKSGPYATFLNFSFGWKSPTSYVWPNTYGISADGLPKNLFINRLRFGLDWFTQEGTPYYPEASSGNATELTYRTRENDDWGFGVNIGYRILPDNYGYPPRLGNRLRLFFSLGAGFIRYNHRWEYQGASRPRENSYTTKVYLKIPVTLEYLFNKHWGMGVEARYYLCPQYDQMKGIGINVVIKYAIK